MENSSRRKKAINDLLNKRSEDYKFLHAEDDEEDKKIGRDFKISDPSYAFNVTDDRACEIYHEDFSTTIVDPICGRIATVISEVFTCPLMSIDGLIPQKCRLVAIEGKLYIVLDQPLNTEMTNLRVPDTFY